MQKLTYYTLFLKRCLYTREVVACNMRLREYYKLTRIKLPDDALMEMCRQEELLNLEVIQLKQKLHQQTGGVFDGVEEPQVTYPKELFDEYKKKSASLRRLTDKIDGMEQKILKLSELTSPSEYFQTEKDYQVYSEIFNVNLEMLKQKIFRKFPSQIEGYIVRGEGSFEKGLAMESKKLKDAKAILEKLQPELESYRKHEAEITRIIIGDKK